MAETSSPEAISTVLQQIAKQAVEYPDTVFTTLAHHMTVPFMKHAFKRLRKNAAGGVDKVTARGYAENLEANLCDLHKRCRNGTYRAQPARRVWLDKSDGGQRPIGIPVLEDKILQSAVRLLLEPIYEAQFYDFSYGFRPKRNPHQALHALRERAMGMDIRWVLDADIKGYFDSIDHGHLREAINNRVKDGAIMRYLGKWLKAGSMDGELYTPSETGTPQGGVISPLLSNIFLHYVLDDWFETQVKPRMQGRCFLVRYADDFVIGFEIEADARKVMEVLPKRFARFGLTIHPDKTRLIPFARPRDQDDDSGTFDFLGFTHLWGRTRKGGRVIKRQTRGPTLRAKMSALWRWCKGHRHAPLPEQHQTLCRKLRGHYQYYGVRCNYRSLGVYYEQARRAWRHWLSRRCSKGNISWGTFMERYHKAFALPRPRIVHLDV